MIQIDIITLFPEDVYNMINFSISGRAIDQGLVTINCVNPRDFASNRHATVDDRPYGGGPGMVMMVDPPSGRRLSRSPALRKKRQWSAISALRVRY